MVEISDRIAIEEAMGRYFRLVDSGRAAEVADMFTPDARMTFAPGSPKPGTIAGDAIAAAMAARQAQTDVSTRHILTNIALDGRDDGSVHAYAILTLYRSEGPGQPWATTIADVEDLYVRHQGAWRIATRLITPILVA